mgnify:CR=1 FL=1
MGAEDPGRPIAVEVDASDESIAENYRAAHRHYLESRNALEDLEGRSRPLTLEQVRAARPDLIVCSWCGAKKLRPEVIEARGLGVPVVAIAESGLGRPGPRLLEGARALRVALDGLSLA